MKRREFLRKGLLVAGAMGVSSKVKPEVVLGVSSGEAKLKIGIISDVHISAMSDTNTLEKALTFFRDHEVDGVLIAGDMADSGLVSQLKWLAETWYKVFPKNKTPSGHPVEKLFVYGNHDMFGDASNSNSISSNKASFWKLLFKEEYSDIYMKDVNGYKFVGAHWGMTDIGDFLEAHRSELEGDKPFFFFEHPHPKNTCYGEWAWGSNDSGNTAEALSKFPNCVAFSGHSHTVLNDNRSVWQGAFTSIGTSSLKYTYTLGGRENVYIDGDTIKAPYQMPNLGQGDGRQGMLMTVYSDRIVLERREFVYDEKLGDDWVIPLPFAAGKAPFSYAIQADRNPVPAFPAGSKATVSRATGNDRYGVSQMQTTVHFPNVLTKNAGVRAFDYEVQLEMQEMDVVRVMLTKRVMSPAFYLGEGREPAEATCVFGEKEVPQHRKFRFVVRPCNCFSRKGDPIYSDWMKLS